jgi:cytochrome c peroxidase
MKTIVERAAKRPTAGPTPRRFGPTAVVTLLIVAVGLTGVLFLSGPTWGKNLAAPPSLKTVPIPEPNNLGLFLRSDPNILNADGFPTPTPEARKAAIALGKALFWDMQVGSDGVQSCASCHFQAGADNRYKNSVNPGVLASPPDPFYTSVNPDGKLPVWMFPFTKHEDPEDRFSPILYDTNDVVSSMGVHNVRFDGLPVKGAAELGTVIPDPVFNVGGVNTRRVEPRNAPTVINAVHNFANFWDGRANPIFNGCNPFGDADPNAGIYVNVNGAIQKQRVSIPFSSLASQAVGPPGSDFEMSYAGRSFPNIGRKLIKLRPLAQQMVHPQDSVLGKLSRGKYNKRKGLTGKPGLKTSYRSLIMRAFQDQYYNSSKLLTFASSKPRMVDHRGRKQVLGPGKAAIVDRPAADVRGPNVFTQMEANFSLFFGLAVQLYEATLVSDDSPYDRFQEGDDTAMSMSAQMGLNIFMTGKAELINVGGSCINCHAGPLFTAASVDYIGAHPFGERFPEQLMQRMPMGNGGGAWYDNGYYNIGVRPTEEDLGRGGTDPFGYPLSFTGRALTVAQGGTLPFVIPTFDANGTIILDGSGLTLPCGNELGLICPNDNRTAVAGSFKTPTMRNVELTGPFFHNGGAATLMQVMDHYTRGGTFNERNFDTLAADIGTIKNMKGNEEAQNQVIDFMIALTDERVRWETAPFDHPELFIPNGSPKKARPPLKVCGGVACDQMLHLPAVGRRGLGHLGLPPVKPFLGLDVKTP